MADNRRSKLSCCSLAKSLNASDVKPQNQILFQEFKGGKITKQEEKPNMTIDLRHPQLVHLYSFENGTVAHNKLNGIEDTPGPSKAVSSPSRFLRPQTARRGGHFRGFNVRDCSRSEIISDVRESMTDRTGDSGHLQSRGARQSLSRLERNREYCATSYMCSESGVNPESTHKPIRNQVSCSVGRTDVIDVTAIAQSDLNFPNLSMHEANNTNMDASNKPSTIIHLKLVAPSSGIEELEAFNVATQSKSWKKTETCSITPSGFEEENLDSGHLCLLSKDSVSSVNPDPMPEQSVDGRATKRKLGDVSDCDSSSSSDDDLPLIVHCKRSKKIASEVDSLRDGKLTHEVKRTYERGIAAQHGSGSAVGRAEDPQKSAEKRGIVYEKSSGSDTVLDGSGREGLEMTGEPLKRSVRPQHSGGSSSRQRQLEEYERNSYTMRNATDSKTTPGRKVRVPGKTPSDGESPRNSKRPTSQVKKVLPAMATKKTRVLRCLRPGPVSLKRKQMKEFGVNPKMMSQVLKELTERKIPVGRTSMSFMCNSHQNYYDGCLVFRLTESLPAKEKVMVHVPVESIDDLDPVGKDALVLWRMSVSEVDELQKQVKQEMEHKRTEHIMPVVLQMSYEQIETAYEQVKKDMKTYEITENDSDVEDEEEDDEEEKQQDDEVEDESKDKQQDEERGKDKRHEEGGDKVEELENDTDENLHVRSYEIIVHDESSKTISCETVKYLEWRKKHPSFENGESEALRKEVENPGVFETGVENDPPVESPNAVKHTNASTEQTNYSRSRPKRHAVDYSPNAFAPIRLMEGKRLGGKKTPPAKLQTKKKTVNDKCQGRTSITSPHDTSEGGDVLCGLKGGQKNHKNRSSGEAGKNKSSAKAARRSGGCPKLSKSPERELATTSRDITSKNTLNTISPNCEPAARDDNHNVDADSDDEVPVILDMSDMPLSPAASSPTALEQLPVLCEHNNYLEKQPPSAYDVVRNEYIRLRDLTRAGAADNTVMSSDVPVSGVLHEGGEDCDSEMCRLDEKLHREEIEHVPLLSSESVVDEQNPSRESSDLSQIHLEAFAPTHSATNGGCLANMPSLQRHCGDILGTAAEEPMAPPDLGLPIECVNSQQQQQQHPASPVLPPVLQVEAGEMNDSGDVRELRSIPLMLSSSESIGGGGDTTALCDAIAGDVH